MTHLSTWESNARPHSQHLKQQFEINTLYTSHVKPTPSRIYVLVHVISSPNTHFTIRNSAFLSLAQLKTVKSVADKFNVTLIFSGLNKKLQRMFASQDLIAPKSPKLKRCGILEEVCISARGYICSWFLTWPRVSRATLEIYDTHGSLSPLFQPLTKPSLLTLVTRIYLYVREPGLRGRACGRKSAGARCRHARAVASV